MVIAGSSWSRSLRDSHTPCLAAADARNHVVPTRGVTDGGPYRIRYGPRSVNAARRRQATYSVRRNAARLVRVRATCSSRVSVSLKRPPEAGTFLPRT